MNRKTLVLPAAAGSSCRSVCTAWNAPSGPRPPSSAARATGRSHDVGSPTYPIVLAFDAMNAFLAAEQIDLFRIIHGEQRFAYERPVRLGDVLTATLSVVSLRQIGGADIIGTSSAITDADGALVCTGRATLVHSGGAPSGQQETA